jgi:hypothetical protein
VRLGIALALASAAWGHGPITTKLTWTKEISRIVHKRCGSCHRESGAAPFSMLSYDEARPWATAIKEEVLARRMPPWGAVKGFGAFEPDLGLTAEEIHLLADWAEGGAPEGDAAYLPPKPNYTLEEKEPVPDGIRVEGRLRLRRALRLEALRVEDVEKDGALKAVARLPGGEVAPLVWLYAYDPRFARSYRLRTPLRLPAGTVVELSGKGALRLIPGGR